MRSTILMLALALLASPAVAQTTGGPTPGTGTGTGTGASTGVPTDLDLPLTKPVLAQPQPPPAPDDGDEDDPRDEPPPIIYGEEIESESDTIFYVIDISCSMDWDTQSYTTLDGSRASGNRMDRAKTELSRSIMGLSQNFKFNCLAYDCGTRMWQREMKEADDANKAAALGWVRGLQPTGATGTGPATAQALAADRSNMSVVLLTDGAPNCGVPEDNDWYNWSESAVIAGHRRMINNGNSQRATINVFGIAASGSYRSFCVSVASDAGGSYFDVP